jgi:hypothetical protein
LREKKKILKELEEDGMPSVKSAKQTLIHDDTKEGEVAVHYNFFFSLSVETPDTLG